MDIETSIYFANEERAPFEMVEGQKPEFELSNVSVIDQDGIHQLKDINIGCL